MSDQPIAQDDDQPQTLVGISFADVFRAREFMTAASRLASRDEVKVNDAVLVVKDDEGKTKVTETIDPTARNSAWSGALWTGLFGLILGGPVGWLAGAAVGAGTGAAAAKVIDLGVSDEWVGWFRAAVEPGAAAVVLLLGEYDEEALVAEVDRFTGGKLMYANVDDGLRQRLADALGHELEPDPVHDPDVVSEPDPVHEPDAGSDTDVD